MRYTTTPSSSAVPRNEDDVFQWSVIYIIELDLQYADDCAILAHTAEELQTSFDLTEAYQILGLSINIRKTKIIYQSATLNIEGPLDIKLSGTNLEVVEHFSYLGSLLSTPYMLCQHIIQETEQSSLRK